MRNSAGIIIKYKESFLLCHPTNQKWEKTFSIPKGGIEDGETIKEAAIRETFEEVGIKFEKNEIEDQYITIVYRDRKNKIFKKVFAFLVEIDCLSKIGLDSEVLPKDMLQLEEVDWAGFIKKSDLDNKCFWRFKQILLEI